jgi:cytochrome c oxidase cbb3-type subunit 3
MNHKPETRDEAMSDISHPTPEPDEGLTDHSYDGIQEYDNPTPAWWTWIFLGTIGFSFVYLLAHLITLGLLSPSETYKRDYVESLKAQYGQLGDVKPDAATLTRLMGDEKWVKVGQSIFLTNCATCHGTDGSGITGPNLTDDYYINIKKLDDFGDVIANGRKNGAMPAWGNRLQPVEQVLVATYVASLRGKNLPSVGARPVEGEKIPSW